MFREMRRKKQVLTEAEIIAILNRNTSGVLALSGDEGYPYAVPLSYAYEAGKLYFHGALQGHKLDAIRQESKASFCVIDQDEVVREAFSTDYKSVILFGRARILEDDLEKRNAIYKIAQKYGIGSREKEETEVSRSWDALCVFELGVEHMSGKQAKRLMQQETF